MECVGAADDIGTFEASASASSCAMAALNTWSSAPAVISSCKGNESGRTKSGVLGKLEAETT